MAFWASIDKGVQFAGFDVESPNDCNLLVIFGGNAQAAALKTKRPSLMLWSHALLHQDAVRIPLHFHVITMQDIQNTTPALAKAPLRSWFIAIGTEVSTTGKILARIIPLTTTTPNLLVAKWQPWSVPLFA